VNRKSSNGHTERIIYELAVMSRRRVSIRELAERTECSERTIKRDFDFIRERLDIELVLHRNGLHCTWSCDSQIRIPKPIGM